MKAALKGVTGQMVIFKRVSQKPYKIEYELADLSLVANAESVIKPSMMVDDTRMSDELRDYIAPLIEGEVELKTKNGIVTMAEWKKVLVK